jgi:hypothetical protein
LRLFGAGDIGRAATADPATAVKSATVTGAPRIYLLALRKLEANAKKSRAKEEMMKTAMSKVDIVQRLTRL